MGKLGTCAYRTSYDDMLTGKAVDYSCPRPLHQGHGTCIFHTVDCSCAGHDDDARRALLEEIGGEAGRDADDGIVFAGCRVPEVAISGIRTKRALCFADARFLAGVEFFDMECGGLDLVDATFSGPVRINAAAAGALRLRKSAAAKGGGARIEIHKCRLGSLDASLARAPSMLLRECDISGGASFRGAKIGEAAAANCTFGGPADFSGCRFRSAEFNAATFGSAAAFEGAAFAEAGRFRRARFGEQGLVSFGPFMANVSFLHTDITRVRFSSDTVWNSAGDPYRILDERELAKGRRDVPLSGVLSSYRNLRECHEYWMMYREAGQFYAREMDLRRRRSAPGPRGGGRAARARAWLRRYASLSNGYNVLCGYGEDFGRASAWLAALFVASTACFFALPAPGGAAAPDDLSLRAAAALERTLSAFLHAGRGDIADHAVRILSLPVLGSMFLVLKRRLERKFRH